MTLAGSIFGLLGLATGLGTVAWAFRHPDDRQGHRLGLAIMFGFYTLADAENHDPVSAAISAAFTAVFLWLWWTNGGGKKTKRRLKRALRFKGVRRTAPVTM